MDYETELDKLYKYKVDTTFRNYVKEAIKKARYDYDTVYSLMFKRFEDVGWIDSDGNITPKGDTLIANHIEGGEAFANEFFNVLGYNVMQDAEFLIKDLVREYTKQKKDLWDIIKLNDAQLVHAIGLDKKYPDLDKDFLVNSLGIVRQHKPELFDAPHIWESFANESLNSIYNNITDIALEGDVTPLGVSKSDWEDRMNTFDQIDAEMKKPTSLIDWKKIGDLHEKQWHKDWPTGEMESSVFYPPFTAKRTGEAYAISDKKRTDKDWERIFSLLDELQKEEKKLHGGEASETYTCTKCGKVGNSFEEMSTEECPADKNATHQIPIMGD